MWLRGFCRETNVGKIQSGMCIILVVKQTAAHELLIEYYMYIYNSY